MEERGVGGLPRQVSVIEDGIIEHHFLIEQIHSREAALNPAGTPVVGRGRQVGGAEFAGQIGEIANGGVGRAHHVAPLVEPAVDGEPVELAGAAHELPHPHRAGTAHRSRGVTRFDQRQVGEIAGQAARDELGTNHRLIVGHPLQPDRHALAGVTGEEIEVVLDPILIRPGRDVDVEHGAQRGGLRLDAGTGRRRAGFGRPRGGQPIEDRGVEGRVARLLGQCDRIRFGDGDRRNRRRLSLTRAGAVASPTGSGCQGGRGGALGRRRRRGRTGRGPVGRAGNQQQGGT